MNDVLCIKKSDLARRMTVHEKLNISYFGMMTDPKTYDTII